MKGIKIALIAVLTTLAVGLAVVLANVLSGGLSFGGLFWGENWSLFSGNGIMPGSGSIFGNATLQAETELPGDNIGEISVDFNKTGCDIIFLPSEDDSIRVKEYYNKEIDENKRALITMADSSLVIRQRLNTGLSTSIRNVSGYVEIYIPGTVYSALKKLNVSTTSGDVSVPKWDGVDEMNMDKLEISTTSGDIDVEWLRAREARMNSTSGDLTMGVMSGNLSMNATSGDMEVSEIEGRLVMSGTSGSQTAGQYQRGFEGRLCIWQCEDEYGQRLAARGRYGRQWELWLHQRGYHCDSGGDERQPGFWKYQRQPGYHGSFRKQLYGGH